MAIEPAPVVSELTIADPKFRRSFFAFRVLLLGLWVAFVRLGLLDVSTHALIVSASIVAVYDVVLLCVEIQITMTGRQSARINAVVRHLDVVMTTVVMVAQHDVRNPVFMIYFFGLLGAAHLGTRREMSWQAAWVTANYLAFAAITAALGHSVSWSYVAVVTIGLQLMGLNALILAGGEQRLRDFIASVAVTDSLTGLPNRRRFHESYPQSIEEALAQNTPLALMLIDFDKFKDINDTLGHPAGDDKLRDVGQALQSVVRSGDLVARYGGDEFIVVAPHSTREHAQILAERLRTIAHTCGASVSIGLAMFPDDAPDQDALIEAADAALYLAKDAGRNCVREPVAA